MTVETTLPQLNKALTAYIRAAGRGVVFGLVKQSQELSRNLALEAKGLMPAKGAVRAARLEAFKQFEGIRVGATARKYADSKTTATASSVRTKGAAIFMEKNKKGDIKKNGRNWWQLAVARELSLRESGRGFLHHADKFDIMSNPERRIIRRLQKNSKSRYGPILGEFAFTSSSDVSNGESGTAEFKWGGFSELSNDAVKAMGRTKGQAAMARAIVATVDNIIPYLERKLGEDAAKVFAFKPSATVTN